MILTAKQEEGLKIAVDRYKHHEAYTCISGYAGTGKSTLVKFIVAALGIDPSDVAYVAYTGKAAQVLRSKGCMNARTAHKLLYRSVRDEYTGKFVHIPRKRLEAPYRLIIVDEISMLPQSIWQHLLSHRIPVIALGDPGQLPPVAEASNGVLDNPHIFLDQVMRQAEDNEIIRLTMDIRDRKPLELFRGNDIRIVDSDELSNGGIWTWANQILVAKNATRHAINGMMRRAIYGEDVPAAPVDGDRIICLRNDWDTVNETGDALVNGLSGTIHNIVEGMDRKEDPFTEEYFHADFEPDLIDACPFGDLKMDKCLFTEHRISKNLMQPNKWLPMEIAPEQFDYGYAITCHKAQGSEFDKVLVLEEYLRGDDAEDHARWLYTAATRASKKLIIVKDFRI